MTSIAIVVPADNQGPEFGARLVRLADYFAPYQPSYEFSYVLVDDASTDETLALCKTFARYRRNVTVIAHDRRYGLGHALRTAISEVCADYTIVVDGSLNYMPSAAMELLEALENSGADVAVASPYMRGGHVLNTPFFRRIAGRFTNRFLSIVARGRCATFTCILRAYRTSFLKRLSFHSDGSDSVPELLYAAMRAGGHIVEVPTRKDWSGNGYRALPDEPRADNASCSLWPALRLGAAIMVHAYNAQERGFH